jgi:hypothetical protein
MRTSFHHQPEAQHPNFQLSTSWQADYPIFWQPLGPRDVRFSAAVGGIADVQRPDQADPIYESEKDPLAARQLRAVCAPHVLRWARRNGHPHGIAADDQAKVF